MSAILQLLGIASIAGIAAGLLWGCGLLAGRALLPRRLLPILPLAAPFLGFSLISTVGHYAGAAGFSLRSVLWLPVCLAAAGWAVVLLDRKLRRLPGSSAPVLGICLLAFLFAVGPLFVLGYLTTVGATVDAVSYAVRSEYLQTASLHLPEIQPGKPYLGWVRLQLDLLRAGDVYFVGLLGLLTGRRSYELLTVVPALFFALTAAAGYVLARVGFGMRRLAGLTAAALLAVNNFLLWPVYDNFLSQTIALAFLPVVLAFGVEGARRPGWRMAALFALAWSGLVSVYPVFALRALAAVLLFWGLSYLRRPRTLVLWWLGAIGLAVLWNGVALARSAAELGLLSGALSSTSRNVGMGNVHLFPPVMEVFGLISHAAAAQGSRWERIPLPILNALALAFAGLAVYGWWRLRPRARLAAASLLATGLLLAAQQRWGAQYPYGYFKALTTVVAEILVLVAAGLVALWTARRPGVRWLAPAAALLLLAVNVKHGLWSQSHVLAGSVELDRELIGIGRAASEVEPDAWVLIDLKTGLRQNWLGYLIRDRKIRYREPLRMGDVDNPGAEDAYFRYAVVEREVDGLRRRTTFEEPWYDPASYSQLNGNGRYELRERRDPLLAGVRLDRRWPDKATLAVGTVGKLSIQLGTDAREGQAGEGEPRTVQVRLYSMVPSRFELAGTPVELAPGGWLLDVDLGCFAGKRLAIVHAGGDAIISDVRSLRTVTGRPGACLETVPLATGAAYIEQDDLGHGLIGLRATLLRPEGAGAQRYRLSYHVIELNRGTLFGVWSLDFPAEPRVQYGTLELDLRDRTSRGEIDGRPVALEVSHTLQDAGFFEADAVWWQFEPLDQLQVQSMLWFHRGGEQKLRITAFVPRARLEILTASE